MLRYFDQEPSLRFSCVWWWLCSSTIFQNASFWSFLLHRNVSIYKQSHFLPYYFVCLLCLLSVGTWHHLHNICIIKLHIKLSGYAIMSFTDLRQFILNSLVKYKYSFLLSETLKSYILKDIFTVIGSCMLQLFTY